MSHHIYKCHVIFINSIYKYLGDIYKCIVTFRNTQQHINTQIKVVFYTNGAPYTTYLIVRDDGTAYWSNTISTKHHSITEANLVDKIKFLVDNIYIQVDNRTFGQTIGIPMGMDCSPLLANLFLFY